MRGKLYLVRAGFCFCDQIQMCDGVCDHYSPFMSGSWWEEYDDDENDADGEDDDDSYDEEDENDDGEDNGDEKSTWIVWKSLRFSSLTPPQ